MDWRRRSEDDYDNNPSWLPSERQQAFLQRNGIIPREWTRAGATRAIAEFIEARRRLPPTPLQESMLRGSGQWRDGMTRGEAFDLIGETMPDRDDL